MLDRIQTGDLFGLYLENKELSADEFLKLMNEKGAKKTIDKLRVREGGEECSH